MARRIPFNKPPQAVRFVNIKTGRIVRAPSQLALAKRMGWAQQRVNEACSGKILRVSGHLEASVARHRLALKDVYGNETTATVRELSRAMSSCAVRRLLKGDPHCGIAPVEYDFGPVRPLADRIVAYRFRVPHPKGIRGRPRIVAVPTLKSVADAVGIAPSSAFRLVHGFIPSCAGITFAGVVTEPRSALPDL